LIFATSWIDIQQSPQWLITRTTNMF
jgi:hypothetical protein